MKLYAEETLEKAITTAIYQYGLWLENEQNLTSGKVVIKKTELKKQVIDALTPIELPSDEEIVNYIEKTFYGEKKYYFKAGVEFMKEQILNQNK